MREKLRFLGMDVHAETIAVAVADRMARFAAWERSLTGKSRFASSSVSLVRLSIFEPAMKPARRDSYCTGS